MPAPQHKPRCPSCGSDDPALAFDVLRPEKPIQPATWTDSLGGTNWICPDSFHTPESVEGPEGERAVDRSHETLAVMRAAQEVRDGRWYMGAPSHVFAELLTALERSGWRLTPTDPTPGQEDERVWTIYSGPDRNGARRDQVIGPPTHTEFAGPDQYIEVTPLARYEAAQEQVENRNLVVRDLGELVSRFCEALGEPVPVDAIARAEQLQEQVERLRAERDEYGVEMRRLRGIVDDMPYESEWELAQELKAERIRLTQIESERDRLREAVERYIRASDLHRQTSGGNASTQAATDSNAALNELRSALSPPSAEEEG